MIPLQCKQSTRVSRDYFKMRFDLSERIIWAGPNTMIYFHYTWKKNNYCRIHHLWIRQSVLNVDNVIVIAALLYNNLAMTSPYWCLPSRLCLFKCWNGPISMAWRVTAVAPLLTHWSCCGLALSHRFNASMHWDTIHQLDQEDWSTTLYLMLSR